MAGAPIAALAPYADRDLDEADGASLQKDCVAGGLEWVANRSVSVTCVPMWLSFQVA
jgi:hypothetical protein